MQLVARAWLAFDLVGTSTALGGVFIGFGVSSLLATPFGGAAADRVRKRTIIAITQSVQALTAAAIGVAEVTGVLDYWMLIVGGVIQGVVLAYLGPARLAFTAELVEPEKLPNAVFLGQISLNSTRMVGPAVAGVLIGVNAVGAGGVYLIASAFMVFGVLAAFGLPAGDPRPNRVQRTALGDVADGIAYVRRRPAVGALVVVSFVVVMVTFPYIVFLPVIAEDLFDVGATGYGVLTAASAVGALAASFSLANVARSLLWSRQAVAGIALAVSLVGLALAPTYPVALAVIVVVGAATAAFQALNSSLVLTIADLEYHGRMQSLLMLSFSGFGLIALPMGILADAVGIRETIAGMGIVAFVAMAAYTAVIPKLRRPALNAP